MIRYLILFVILAFVFIGLLAVIRMMLRGPRDRREDKDE
jgi:uncharacterized protein involved in exopolysaccharide biosynthesis